MPIGRFMFTKKSTKSHIDPEIQYHNILGWMYINDGNYPDKNKWREAFLEMLRFNILETRIINKEINENKEI